MVPPKTNISPEQRIGRVIRERRKARGWSQEDFGFEVGLHRTYVGVIERGEKSMSVGSLVKVAKTLGLKASELLQKAGF